MKHIRKTLMALILVTVLLTSCQSTDIRREGTVYYGTESAEYHIPESLYVETKRPLTCNELMAADDYPEYMDVIASGNIEKELYDEAMASKQYPSVLISTIMTEDINGLDPEEMIRNITMWIENNLDTPAYIIFRNEDCFMISCSFELKQEPVIHIMPGTGFSRGTMTITMDLYTDKKLQEASIQIGDPATNENAAEFFLNGKWYYRDYMSYLENIDEEYYQEISDDLNKLVTAMMYGEKEKAERLANFNPASSIFK